MLATPKPDKSHLIDSQQSVGPMMVSPYGASQALQRHIVVQCVR